MADYGVLENGFVRKSAGAIKSEIQDYLTERYGFDVRENPMSLMNVLITTMANKYGELWQVAEDVYYAQYPTTASGDSLDKVAQLCGYLRRQEEKTYYSIRCGCEGNHDNTVIPQGTRVATNITPVQYFVNPSGYVISADSCNSATIKVGNSLSAGTFSLTFNGNTVSYTAGSTTTVANVLGNLTVSLQNIYSNDVVATSDYSTYLNITSLKGKMSVSVNNRMVLDKIYSDFMFESEEYGAFDYSNGQISVIATPVTNLVSVSNVELIKMGGHKQSDTEFRLDLMNNLTRLSTYTAEAVENQVMSVDGVHSCNVVENSTDSAVNGVPAHGMIVYVDDFDGSSNVANNADIAKAILRAKPVGIATGGSVSVSIPDVSGQTVVVNFARPNSVNVYLQITTTVKTGETRPSNYASVITSLLRQKFNQLKAGESVYLQDFIADIKAAVPALGVVTIKGKLNAGDAYALDYIPIVYWQVARLGGDPSYVTS